MWYPVAFSYSCQGVRDAKVFYVFMDMAYKLVGELSPFNVYRLVTRNSTMTLEDMITFFCPQFPAILLCLSTTPALQINFPSAPYRLTRRSLLSLPGSYLLDNVSKQFLFPVLSQQSSSLSWKRKLSTLFGDYRSSSGPP